MLKQGQMEIKNIMERAVSETFDKMVKNNKDFCCCDICKADVIAYTLNKVKPRYVVSNKGEVITRVDADMRQTQAEILSVILQAMEMVKKNPRH